jgi:hypothetical protein
MMATLKGHGGTLATSKGIYPGILEENRLGSQGGHHRVERACKANKNKAPERPDCHQPVRKGIAELCKCVAEGENGEEVI